MVFGSVTSVLAVLVPPLPYEEASGSIPSLTSLFSLNCAPVAPASATLVSPLSWGFSSLIIPYHMESRSSSSSGSLCMGLLATSYTPGILLPTDPFVAYLHPLIHVSCSLGGLSSKKLPPYYGQYYKSMERCRSGKYSID